LSFVIREEVIASFIEYGCNY